MTRAVGVIALVAAGAAAIAGGSASAHLTAVSPYTYTRDVLPILEARCGRCHTNGSASGLMLLDYKAARGATWTIRQRLIRGHMPPWFAEGPFHSPEPVTARELNILMTWAAGGGPEGKPVPPRDAAASSAWPMGTPELVATMPTAFTFTADQGDQVHEVAFPSTRIAGRRIRAVDVRPGNAAIVRSAEILAVSGTSEQVLGVWQPGEAQAHFAVDAGMRVASNARLVARIRFRRWYGAPASDRSEIGVYFAGARSAALQTLAFNAEPSRPHSIAVRRGTRLVAVRPISGPSGSIVRISVVLAKGGRRELARLQMQPDWNRRYVFRTPETLDADSRLEVSVEASSAPLWTALTSEKSDPDSAVRIAIEFVS